jgi:hypothetical protein
MRVLSPRITNKSLNDIGSGIDRLKAEPGQVERRRSPSIERREPEGEASPWGKSKSKVEGREYVGVGTHRIDYRR